MLVATCKETTRTTNLSDTSASMNSDNPNITKHINYN